MWSNVKVYALDGLYNQHHQLLSTNCHWCNAVGEKTSNSVSRVSDISDRLYVDRACAKCAAKWQKLI